MNPDPPPQPTPDPDTEGFWSATAAGRLELCWCPACERYLHPPLERCRSCAGETARIGMPLKAEVVPLPGGGFSVPVFRPVPRGAGHA